MGPVMTELLTKGEWKQVRNEFGQLNGTREQRDSISNVANREQKQLVGCVFDMYSSVVICLMTLLS